MKRLFTLLILLCSFAAFSQQYNNEWIDYSKTYYKLKVGRTGLYRISPSVLSAVGLAGTSAEQFKLIRNGVEVPIFTSVSSGTLSGSDYIEFWGDINDGKPDQPLYRNPAFQHTDKLSLQTDTAVYFLTVDAGPNLRFSTQPNNVAGNVLPREEFFMYTTGKYFKDRLNSGFARDAGEYVYSSSYDRGEYWSSREITPSTPLVDAISNLFVFPSGPSASLKFGASGNVQNARTINVRVNNTPLLDSVMSVFDDIKSPSISFPVSLISTNTASVRFGNTSTIVTDRMVVSHYTITYPRLFNFGATRNFPFTLPAKTEGYYLAITNFIKGAVTPVLYDITNQHRYLAVPSAIGDTLKFVLPGGGERNLVLVNEENVNIIPVNTLTPKAFINFNDPANQGDYLIISNPILYTGTNGNNPVEDYKAYRNSAIGGGFNTLIVDINELVDQFAFGIKKHPLSIKNYLKFAREKFSAPPRFVFLIGKGINYMDYRKNESLALVESLNLVPGFGYPASDNMLSSANGASSQALTPIGRLSVVYPAEIESYLEKVKEYDQTQRNAANTIAGRLWMKNIAHVTGASQPELGNTLCNFMHGYKDIAEDTLTGAKVRMFCKSSANPVEQFSSEDLKNLFEDGMSMLSYFGHSSSSTLEFNISNPNAYNNQGKYPVFSVNGCNAGNFFTYNPLRFQLTETLSETFVLSKQRGAIAFVASTHFGIVNYLNIYINSFYKEIFNNSYGQTLGSIVGTSLGQLISVTAENDFFARCHAEQITLHGDPAIKMNFEDEPDYVVEDAQIKISPTFISIAETECTVDLKLFNLGKAVSDSIVLEVKRQFPDGSSEIVQRKKIKGILHSDSFNIKVPVVGSRDKGSNKIIITIDADNEVSEREESNNSFTKEFFIYEDEARPAYPFNYSIVNNPSQTLHASTANPFSPVKSYVMEIDTTTLFNSSLKVSKTVSSVGGTIEFNPGIVYLDSTVYYWRTSLMPAQGEDYRWSSSSFIFIRNGSNGFNQSHYFQHLNSDMTGINLGNERKWNFTDVINNLFLKNAVYPTAADNQSDYINGINGNNILGPGCTYDELIIQVIDPVTFKPWLNSFSSTSGLYNSYRATCGALRQYNFEYLLTTAATRKHAMDFLQNIVPDGAYVIIRSNTNPSGTGNTYPNKWLADTTLHGSGNSLYHKLYNQGFTTLDSFNRARAWTFVYKKNGASKFTPKIQFSNGIYDKITMVADCPTPDSVGYITSPRFGPAKAWKSLHWRGTTEESSSADNPVISVIGIDVNNNQTVLFERKKDITNLDISSIDATVYPFLQLKMRNIDSVTLTPYQLNRWLVTYDAVPEGAVAPNLLFSLKDSLEIGETLNLAVAFKNITPEAFDSVKAKLLVIDQDNVSHLLPLQAKLKPLTGGDTLVFNYSIDTKDFPGNNIVSLTFNPDDDQPEQYLYNNFLFRNFYVKPDNVNPLLDVTFDGVHILNKDIVSAKPHIQIKIKDEAKFMLLNDTSLITDLEVRYPDMNNTVRTYQFNSNDTLRFTPAQSGTDNTATIDFSPYFPAIVDDNGELLNPEGDEYELIIRAKDRSGNNAGQKEYKVSFMVIDKPMISNLLNYPNPFTTSTAFVFTLTGSELPQNMKIQILTVTGKIVKEITKDELGPIRIGRNITEYKWDGTDQYGQRLGNGVYLYRVVTTLNGQRMNKYKSANDDTDRYFNKGYGKMYLMR